MAYDATHLVVHTVVISVEKALTAALEWWHKGKCARHEPHARWQLNDGILVSTLGLPEMIPVLITTALACWGVKGICASALGYQTTDRPAGDGIGGCEAIAIVHIRGCRGTCSPGES